MRPTSSPFLLASALVAVLGASLVEAQTVTRGAYLQLPTPTSIVVRWRTNVATDSRVRYGFEPGDLSFASTDGALTTEHRVMVTGLAPATRYFYSIGSSSLVLQGGDSAHVFVTPPPAGTRAPIRVWAFGDGGTGTAQQLAVRNGFQAFTGARRPDVWLMLGDNAYEWGTDADYQSKVFGTYPATLRTTPLSVVVGNHDLVYPGGNNDLYEIFDFPALGEAGGVASNSEAYWSFDHGNVHFIALDSENTNRSPSGPMMTWLANDVAATNQEWVVAFWHSPPYTHGTHDSDRLSDSGGRMAQMRDWALPILEAAGVDLVLGGHSHTYERSCLLDEQYGPSTNLVDSNRVDGGDGRVGGDGPYLKPTPGKAPHEGTVYVVSGSAGQLPSNPQPDLDHPAMVVGLAQLGSFVADIDGLRLDGRFVDDEGAVLDSFTILKGSGVAGVPGAATGALRLEAPHPNPFRTTTQIAYRIPVAGTAQLAIYDLAGRRMLSQTSKHATAGRFVFDWDGADTRGNRVRPGVYVIELRFGSEHRIARVALFD